MADPHPGNYRFSPDGARVTFLDFGCVKRLPEPFRLALRELIRGALEGRKAAAHAGATGTCDAEESLACPKGPGAMAEDDFSVTMFGSTVTLAVAHLVGDLPRALDPHTRGDLTMLAAPELRDLLAQTCVELARAGDDGRAKCEPRQRGKDEDGCDG